MDGQPARADSPRATSTQDQRLCACALRGGFNASPAQEAGQEEEEEEGGQECGRVDGGRDAEYAEPAIGERGPLERCGESGCASAGGIRWRVCVRGCTERCLQLWMI